MANVLGPGPSRREAVCLKAANRRSFIRNDNFYLRVVALTWGTVLGVVALKALIQHA